MVSRHRWRILALALPLLLLGLVWRQAGRMPRTLPGLGGSATAIAFSPDGQTVVCASSNNFVQKWVPDIAKWRSFQSAQNYMTNLAPLFARRRFSPDG